VIRWRHTGWQVRPGDRQQAANSASAGDPAVTAWARNWRQVSHIISCTSRSRRPRLVGLAPCRPGPGLPANLGDGPGGVEDRSLVRTSSVVCRSVWLLADDDLLPGSVSGSAARARQQVVGGQQLLDRPAMRTREPTSTIR